MTDTTERLWSDGGRNRHFIVPDDAKFDAGDLEIRTVLGESRLVSEASVLKYEVSKVQAKAWIAQELSGVLETAGTRIAEGLSTAARKLREARQAEAGERPSAADATHTASRGVSAHATDSPADPVTRDPAKLIRSLASALDDFREVLGKSQSGSDVDLAEAKARMRRLRQTLEREGISVTDRADELPETLHEFAGRSRQ